MHTRRRLLSLVAGIVGISLAGGASVAENDVRNANLAAPDLGENSGRAGKIGGQHVGKQHSGESSQKAAEIAGVMPGDARL